MEPEGALQAAAQQEFLLYMRQMVGAWELSCDGADVTAITPSGRGLSFTVVGTRGSVWSVRRGDVIGVQPHLPDRWWAFVTISQGSALESTVTLLPDGEAKRVIIALIAADYFSSADRDPARRVEGHIDVPVDELLIRGKGFVRPTDLIA